MKVLPHDLLVEEALLGRMLTRPDLTGEIAAMVDPGDFYRPTHGGAFLLLVDAWRQGQPHDAVSLASHPQCGLRAPEVATILSHAPAAHERLVDRLVELRLRRELILAGEELTTVAQDETRHPLDVRDDHLAAVGQVTSPLSTVPDLRRLDALLDEAPERIDWTIPGLVGKGWRVVVVAAEGAGKSVLSRQLVVAGAAGIHPLAFTPIPRVRTLLVDLENPVAAIAQKGRRMRDMAKRRGVWDPDWAAVWHRPQGIDVRSRHGRLELESVLAQSRPEFVAIGPLYKLYRVSARETDEQASGEVQQVLDDLRSRYGFSVLIEHHAPKKQGTALRDLAPYGSSLWLRWPEVGLKLLYDENHPGSLLVGRWRDDRLPNAWPQRLDRGHDWPWVGWWQEGMADSLRTAEEAS